jgi:hypothetical protein
LSAASLTVRSRSATGRGGGAEVKEEGDDIGEQCSSLVRRQLYPHSRRVTPRSAALSGRLQAGSLQQVNASGNKCDRQ